MINKFLIEHIIYLHYLVTILMSLVFKNALDKAKDDEPIDKEYRKLEVDELPILIANESLNYKDLLKQYFTEHQKDITPVKTRKGATPIHNNIKCQNAMLRITIFMITMVVVANTNVRFVSVTSILKITTLNPLNSNVLIAVKLFQG